MVKPLEVGSLVVVNLKDSGWHGAQVVERAEGQDLYAVELLEASDGYEVGQRVGGFFQESVRYFGEEEPANIKPTDVYIMRAERRAGLSWWATGDSCSVSHGASSLPAAVGSMLTCWEREGRRERGEFPETPRAAAALLLEGRYRVTLADGTEIQYWFKF
jgi:hypothetical protein